MLSRNTLLLTILLAFVAGSCGDKTGKGDLAIQFLATYDGAPLVMLQEYPYNDTLDILFQKFNFYISNLTLLEEGSEKEREVLEIDFVEFDAIDDVAKAALGFVVLMEDLPAHSYKGLNLGLGVPAGLNATQESDYPDSHPLGKASHYWSGWGSYIFTMINGKVDSDGDGQFDDSSVLYHTGSDDSYRTKEIAHQFRVEEGETTTIVLEVDLHKLFLDTDGVHYIDIIANPATHDITNKTITNLVMDNFQNALYVVE